MDRGHEQGTSKPAATLALITLCIVVFVSQFVWMALRGEGALLASLWQLQDPVVLEGAGAMVAPLIWIDGQWWRVLSGGLLHGSWLHLGLNMVGLWSVGQWTERAFGWWRQLLLFALASTGGFLASLGWAEAPVVVGASAGIFGIAGALVVARAWGSEAIQAKMEPVAAKTLGFWLGFWLLVGFVLPLFGVSLLAQAGHIGGLAVGAGVGWVYARDPERRFERVLVASVVLAGFVGLTLMARAPAWRTNYHLFVGLEYLQREAWLDASTHLDLVLAEEPDNAVLANEVAYSFAEAGVELARAEDLVTGALEIDPENPDYLDTLGWVQCKRGLIDEGLASLESAEVAAEHEIPEIREHMDACAEIGAD